MDSAQEQPARFERANLHLRILGEDRTFEVDVPQGPATVLDLLPAAREISGQAMGTAIARSEARGKKVSCRAGCGACCRQMVPVSLVDALSLANLVESMPAERRKVIEARFAAALRALEHAGIVDARAERGRRAVVIPADGDPQRAYSDIAKKYFRLQIACPFLENESCSIYEDRPTICREYHVTSSPELCARVDQVEVDGVQPPLKITDVLAHTVNRLTGTVAGCVPLVLALEWAESHRAALSKPMDGVTMFRSLLGEMDKQFQKPFEKRG